MRHKRLAAVLLSVLLLCGCGAGTAAPAATDEDAPEAVAEAVEEALEALAETADPDADPATAREVAALVEEIVSGEPSAVLSPDEVPEDPDRVCAVSKDALRAVLIASRPDLRKMSKDDRSRFTMRLTTSLGRTPAKTPSVYAAMAARDRKHADDDAELGRRIMEKRNPHYMKQ